jgi:hypothetical protein
MQKQDALDFLKALAESEEGMKKNYGSERNFNRYLPYLSRKGHGVGD